MWSKGWYVAWVMLILGAGCARTPSPADDGQVRILCSFFPIYVFTKNIVGDTPGVSVELLLPAQAGCPHDYDLSPADVKRIASADIYVMNGAGLESFGVDEIKKAQPKIAVVDSSASVAKIEMEHHHDHDEKGHEEHDHGHDHGHSHDPDKGHSHDHDHGHHHEEAVNPHFFSSPKGAIEQVRAITKSLTKLAPEHAKRWREQAESFEGRLKELDNQWTTASKGFHRTEIVTMHEIFDYVARDCGLKVVATINPVAGQDPSPGEMRKVIDRIKETKPAAIFTEPQYPSKVAKMIAEEAGVPVEELDPVASGPSDAPLDYYEVKMKENLDKLVRLLGKP